MCHIVFSLGYYGIKKTTKAYISQGMQLSPLNTADVTLKTKNEIGGCLTQQIIALLFVMTCQSILLRKHGCREIQKGLGLVLCKRVNIHWVYMKYDCKVF